MAAERVLNPLTVEALGLLGLRVASARRERRWTIAELAERVGVSVVTFAYGRSYLARSDAVALYLPELPLRRGEIAPRSGEITGCVADAAPDAWGRRAIELRH